MKYDEAAYLCENRWCTFICLNIKEINAITLLGCGQCSKSFDAHITNKPAVRHGSTQTTKQITQPLHVTYMHGVEERDNHFVLPALSRPPWKFAIYILEIESTELFPSHLRIGSHQGAGSLMEWGIANSSLLPLGRELLANAWKYHPVLRTVS